MKKNFVFLFTTFILAATNIIEFIVVGQYKTGWRFYGFLTGAIFFSLAFIAVLWETVRKRKTVKVE